MATVPASSHGSTFSGGTITQPLDIATAGPAIAQLVIERDDAQIHDLVQVNQVGGGFALEIGRLGSISNSSNDPANPALGIFPLNVPNAGVPIAQVFAGSGAFKVDVSRHCYLVLNQNAAPADAELAASEFTLWLDDTAGATKLMVKAKDAVGAVRTAAIALA